jgi:HPr kinase/phosphorylase
LHFYAQPRTRSPFIAIAEETGCPVLQTGLDSSEFQARLLRILSNIFAPRVSIHGVLVEVYGLGILILGFGRRKERDRP